MRINRPGAAYIPKLFDARRRDEPLPPPGEQPTRTPSLTMVDRLRLGRSSRRNRYLEGDAMTITVDIRPEVQAELARQAAAHGRALEAYAASLLEDAARLRALQSWPHFRAGVQRSSKPAVTTWKGNQALHAGEPITCWSQPYSVAVPILGGAMEVPSRKLVECAVEEKGELVAYHGVRYF